MEEGIVQGGNKLNRPLAIELLAMVWIGLAVLIAATNFFDLVAIKPYLSNEVLHPLTLSCGGVALLRERQMLWGRLFCTGACALMVFLDILVFPMPTTTLPRLIFAFSTIALLHTPATNNYFESKGNS